jgi:opacity protein-like surface antigen
MQLLVKNLAISACCLLSLSVNANQTLDMQNRVANRIASVEFQNETQVITESAHQDEFAAYEAKLAAISSEHQSDLTDDFIAANEVNLFPATKNVTSHHRTPTTTVAAQYKKPITIKTADIKTTTVKTHTAAQYKKPATIKTAAIKTTTVKTHTAAQYKKPTPIKTAAIKTTTVKTHTAAQYKKPATIKTAVIKTTTVKVHTAHVAKPIAKPVIDVAQAPQQIEKTIYKPIKKQYAPAAESPVIATQHKTESNLPWGLKLEPYLGLAHTTRHMKFEPGFGDNVFATTLHAPEVYAGIKLWDYLGLEVGYSKGQNRHKSVALSEGFMGNAFDPDESNKMDSTAKVQTLRGNVLGYIPLDKKKRANILLGVGVTHIKTSNVYQETESFDFPIQNIDLNNRSFKGKANALNFMAGFEYKILPHLGLRGGVTFERSSQIGSLKPIEDLTLVPTLKHKNSKIYSLSINVN